MGYTQTRSCEAVTGSFIKSKSAVLPLPNISFTLAARILCYAGYGEPFVVNMDLNNDQTVFSQICIEKY